MRIFLRKLGREIDKLSEKKEPQHHDSLKAFFPHGQINGHFMNVLWWFSPLFPATLPLSVCVLCVATIYEEEVGEAAAFCVCQKKLSRLSRMAESKGAITLV